MKTEYNKFQKMCKEAWRTEGQGDSEVMAVHAALLACEKKPGMSANETIASAWNIYKNKLKNYQNEKI